MEISRVLCAQASQQTCLRNPVLSSIRSWQICFMLNCFAQLENLYFLVELLTVFFNVLPFFTEKKIQSWIFNSICNWDFASLFQLIQLCLHPHTFWCVYLLPNNVVAHTHTHFVWLFLATTLKCYQPARVALVRYLKPKWVRRRGDVASKRLLPDTLITGKGATKEEQNVNPSFTIESSFASPWDIKCKSGPGKHCDIATT